MNVPSSINDGDMFSSLEEELISNIKRPSLLSLTSEDSTEDKILIPEETYEHTGLNIYGLRTSTPVPKNLPENSFHKNTVYIHEDQCNFKIPSDFPSSRDGKRYSMSIFSDASCGYNLNKSNSMHDMSSFSSLYPLRRDSCMFSTETLQSNSIATTKSKDSGFQRSTSCTSLTTSGSKKYDHVQSKVKQYIQTIKQSEALRKVQKRMDNDYFQSLENLNLESPETSPSNESVTISKKDLLHKVKELEEELKEKDCVIEQLEKNHSELRLKYAAAENRIDDLRIRVNENDDSSNNYITDKKVAELLNNNAKQLGRFTVNEIAKQLTKNKKRDESNISSPYDVSQYIQPINKGNVRELQPIKKFCSNSVKLNENYPVLNSDKILKSSNKYVPVSKYELKKSTSNIDKIQFRFFENDALNLPYEKNSFAKVQRWQRSLVNLNKFSYDMDVCGGELSTNDGANYVVPVNPIEDGRKKSRLYEKNKDADKKQYRKSYPVGCKCEKFKGKSKEEQKVIIVQPQKKLLRSVSFASYDESMTSSIYDEADSSSDSSTMFVPKHESYKDYKQRLQQKKFKKYERGERPKSWNEIKKAKSANNIHNDDNISNRNKRLMDNSSTSHEHSFEQPFSERKHCGRPYNKTKYRKLDDNGKVASSNFRPVVKGASMRESRATLGGEVEKNDVAFLTNSKSLDACGRPVKKNVVHYSDNKSECSCLSALENLKIQEFNSLAKFSEHLHKYPRKVTENEVQVGVYNKRYSMHK